MANSQEELVLAANEAFYRAFAIRDLAAMERVWAYEVAVACVHPGWTPLFGRDAVMESWVGILGNPKSPDILCLEAQATVYGDIAIVLCYEIVGSRYLVATNLFVRENGAWKLFHHQSGLAAAEPSEAVSSGNPVSKRLH